jgi:outer membrane protein, heavy metal efflux system
LDTLSLHDALPICAAIVCLLVATIGGCHSSASSEVDSPIRGLSAPQDVAPSPAQARTEQAAARAPQAPLPGFAESAAVSSLELPNRQVFEPANLENEAQSIGAIAAQYQEPAGSSAPRPRSPLQLPPVLPGADAPQVHLPQRAMQMPPAERKQMVSQLYAELLPLPPSPEARPAPGQPLMTLEALQELAFSRSPVIRQAAADVEAARGSMIQAGAITNPRVYYQADNINTGTTAGYQGVAITQTVPTGGKRKLGEAAAGVDLQNAELTLQRTRHDLAGQVRTQYFAVLVAQEQIRINTVLSSFAEELYRAQITRVEAGEAAPYEPLQVRVVTAQARVQVVQSYHDYRSAWRRLAATVNWPDMQPTALAGRLDAPAPRVSYDAAVRRMLQVHLGLVIARNAVEKARYQLSLARRTPSIPDLEVTAAIQKDYTVPPFGMTYNLLVGAPIPVFNRNGGNVLAADAAVIRACSEYDRVRNGLLSTLADIFARYESASMQLDYYRRGVLVDQARIYRGTYARYQQEPAGPGGASDSTNFNDVLAAYQGLSSANATYIQLMGNQWQAVVELAALLQVDDLDRMGDESLPGRAGGQ